MSHENCYSTVPCSRRRWSQVGPGTPCHDEPSILGRPVGNRPACDRRPRVGRGQLRDPGRGGFQPSGGSSRPGRTAAHCDGCSRSSVLPSGRKASTTWRCRRTRWTRQRTSASRSCWRISRTVRSQTRVRGLTVREERNRDHLVCLCALLDDVADGGVSFGGQSITVSAEAARGLELRTVPMGPSR